MAHAHLSETERTQKDFSILNHAQLLQSNQRLVRNPGRKTSRSRNIPRCQVGQLGSDANLIFLHSDFHKWTPYAVKFCRFAARTKIAKVVRIRAINDNV